MHVKLDSAISSTSGLMVTLSQITPQALYIVMVQPAQIRWWHFLQTRYKAIGNPHMAFIWPFKFDST
jgi:hypothetical protein